MLWRGWLPRLALLLLAGAAATARRGRSPAWAPRPPSDEAVRALLKRRVAAGASKALVVGIIDPDGKRRVIAEAAPGFRAVDGSTVLEIGSIPKVFTAALLADMVERGEVKLAIRSASSSRPTCDAGRRRRRHHPGRARHPHLAAAAPAEQPRPAPSKPTRPGGRRRWSSIRTAPAPGAAGEVAGRGHSRWSSVTDIGTAIGRRCFLLTAGVSAGSSPGHVVGRGAISGVDPGRVRRCGLGRGVRES